MSAVRETDVLVVGGGLVGASLGCALAPLGLDVTLLEAAPPRSDQPPSYDDRTLALGAASCRILEGLGLWPALAPNATAIRQVAVSELDRPGRVVLDADSMGLDRFGNVIEARVFGQAVLTHLESLPGVRYEWPVRATGLEQAEDHVTVTADRDGVPEEWRARLVIGADGAASSVRELLAIPAQAHDYGQVAIICNVTPSETHRNRAFERMTPTGPFALLPHAGTRCGLVWCVPADEAEDVLALDDERFLAAATRRSGQVLGRLERCGRRSSYPLRRVVPERDREGRVLLLGNAAHAIHPVGAQGFNLGLRDAATLAEVLADAVRGEPGADPGDMDLLRRYSAWRKPDQDGTIAYSDGLARIYSNPSALASAGRVAGLVAHALVPPLRRQLATRAMGFRGRIPRLARGEAL